MPSKRTLHPSPILRPLKESYDLSMIDDCSNRYISYGQINEKTLKTLLTDLNQFLAEASEHQYEATSFVATFRQESCVNEAEFRQKYWGMLQRLHIKDDAPWDDYVDTALAEDSFCTSICGRALFVEGMHPASEDSGRLAPYFTVVFAPMQQFSEVLENSYLKVASQVGDSQGLNKDLDTAYASAEQIPWEVLEAPIDLDPTLVYDGLHIYDCDEEDTAA